MDALNKLSRLKESGNLPCLIILDMNMPIMDGKTTLKQIRQDKAFDGVPIVLFTTTKPEDSCHLIEKYSIDVVEKPLNYQMILDAIKLMLVKC